MAAETLSRAWNRYVSVWKHTHKKKRGDSNLVVKVRGYTELAMTDIPRGERKQMHSAVVRGYRLANNRAADFLGLCLSHEDYHIGYIGKTRGQLWLPDTASRDACKTHIEALSVMTDKFNASTALRCYSDNTIDIYIYASSYNSGHLKGLLTETRLVVDEHMDKWKERRMQLADKIMDDSWVCRVPYETNNAGD